jgi:hypothetical protein
MGTVERRERRNCSAPVRNLPDRTVAVGASSVCISIEVPLTVEGHGTKAPRKNKLSKFLLSVY